MSSHDTAIEPVEANEANRWRLETPGTAGWAHSVRPGPDKYFMISVDSHLLPPMNLFRERLDAKFHDRLAYVEKRDDGQRYLIVPGMRPERLVQTNFTGDDLARSLAGGDAAAIADGVQDPVGLERLRDQDRDGVDGEVIFPNGPALLIWSSGDVEFVAAQCRVWNDWAWEVCGPYKDRCNPAATLPAADVELSVREVERVAKMGYRTVIMPCKPIWGSHDPAHINYNLPVFDPVWAAIQEHDLTICYHISTGRDPRTARGNGGAVINFAVHALTQVIEPIVSMCSSGVFERFPKLRVATIEADASWVPWVLQKMDEGYLKHHFWARPKLQALPSEYFHSNCYVSFGEDKAAMDLVELHGLQDNLMWANDYPHHEGTWPFSAQALERTFGPHITEPTRAKLLGLNAAKVFRFDVPERYQPR